MFKKDFTEFEIPSYSEWKEVAEKSLKGKSLESLKSLSYEGIEIESIYSKADSDFSSNNIPDPVLVDSEFPNNYTQVIDTTVLNNTGSNAYCEIAYALDMAINSDQEASEILFVFAINSEFFVQIAKLRAFRFLFNKIFGDDQIPNIMTKQSVSNKTLLDKENNLLRISSEVMSSIIGGALAINIDSFDLSDNEESKRISENIFSIFTEESKIADIKDPSKGSFFIDTLTKQIAGRSFELLKELESKESSVKILVLTQLINETATLRQGEINSRKKKLIGVNIFTNPLDNFTHLPDIEGLRLASEFEEYKLKPNPPKIYIAQLGELKNIKARTDFIVDFLKTGGFEIEISEPFDSGEDLLNTCTIVDTNFIVISAIDDDYKGILPLCVPNILKVKSEKFIMVAGMPIDSDRYLDMGVKLFIHMRSNLKDTLDIIWKENEKDN